MRSAMILVMLASAAGFGCARVNVGGSKEPIKVDISMRLDIYQHVQNDIDSIENIVAGDKKQPAKKTGNNSFLNSLVQSAYAQEVLSPEVEQAALRRKDRRSALDGWEAKGVVGESKAGLAQIVNNQLADNTTRGLVQSENADRMIIYQALAGKYGQTLEEIQKVYAEKLSNQAPAGTPVESFNSSTSSYEWKTK
jgi:uncharacterized protein YdbL (DUF1318 family)